MEENRKHLMTAFMNLPQPDFQVQCLHIWIDGSLRNLRCKTRTWEKNPKSPEDLPLWEFCGSATDFEAGDVADFYNKPVKLYNDPFRCGNNKLVLCETYTREGLPTFANNRHRLQTVEGNDRNLMKRSFYQSYSFLRADGRPLSHMNPAYDIDSKAEFSCGKEVAEAHYKACLYAGVNIRSMECIRNTGQWRYSIGPDSPVNLGDDAWISRFILIRVAEDFGVSVSFETSTSSVLKPIYTSLIFETENVEIQEQQKFVESLYSKFVHKQDPPSKVINLPNKILLDHCNADVDPYSIILRTLDCSS